MPVENAFILEFRTENDKVGVEVISGCERQLPIPQPGDIVELEIDGKSKKFKAVDRLFTYSTEKHNQDFAMVIVHVEPL